MWSSVIQKSLWDDVLVFIHRGHVLARGSPPVGGLLAVRHLFLLHRIKKTANRIQIGFPERGGIDWRDLHIGMKIDAGIPGGPFASTRQTIAFVEEGHLSPARARGGELACPGPEVYPVYHAVDRAD